MTVDKRSSSSLVVYGHPAVGSDETYIYILMGKVILLVLGRKNMLPDTTIFGEIKATAPTTIWETDKRPSKQLHQNSPSSSDMLDMLRTPLRSRQHHQL